MEKSLEMIVKIIDWILHIDKYLNVLIQSYGAWIYLLIFLIVFIETGFVFVPFLPGDSLLFAAGTFAAVGSLNVYLIFIVQREFPVIITNVGILLKLQANKK